MAKKTQEKKPETTKERAIRLGILKRPENKTTKRKDMKGMPPVEE